MNQCYELSRGHLHETWGACHCRELAFGQKPFNVTVNFGGGSLWEMGNLYCGPIYLSNVFLPISSPQPSVNQKIVAK